VAQTNGGTVLRIAALVGNRIDLSLNGGGRIDVARVDAQDLSVTLAGDGVVALAGTTLHLRARLYGSTSLDAEKLTSADAVLVSGSSGPLIVGVRYNSRVSATSSGAVRVIGNGKCAVVGQGPVECANIEARRTD
jgi:hypothetical protein